NDATGLVLYNFAVAAVLSGTFSLLFASAEFVYVVVVGIGVGLAIGWVIAELHLLLRPLHLSDPIIAVAISLVTPFALYVPASALGASGVLAAAAGGMYLSRRSNEIFDADSRIATSSVWNFLFFAFNGAAFVLIGLQLPAIVRALRAEHFGTGMLIGFSLVIALIIVLVRYVWVFAVSRLRRLIDPRIAQREGPLPPWTWTFVLGTAGMRGIVSLAAALAIPDSVAGGTPFPFRNLILFTTFVVIVVTLVGEGLLLPVLIRKLGVVESEGAEAGLSLAKVRTAEAALAHLRSLEATFESTAEWEVVGRLQSEYGQRLDLFSADLNGQRDEVELHEHVIEGRLRREAFGAERRALGEMRRHGEITDEVYRQIQKQIDLAESRLAMLQPNP
ncbi:MAG TPA: cation:proton antiporter, partial [Candidatus Acidoferrum sp.]|nr:cation:proton antiporter [Candidatus Acidoferrum sp.]